MSLKLKLKTGGHGPSQQDGATPQTAGSTAASPAPSTASTGGPRLTLKASKPPTPAGEQPGSTAGAAGAKKAAAPRKPTAGKKRGAADDISPAPKRIVSDAQAVRKPSLKIKPSATPYSGYTSATPLTAGGVNKIKLAPPRKQSTARIKALTTHNVRREIPKRETGVGYDSEDSEREDDPAIQQGLILRMQPGVDADELREAITNGKIGLKPEETGSFDASIKFVTPDLRRACVRVRRRLYAAALVDLPCIVESMKSWDKKGWWKVADVCQMLLVLGEVKSEAEIREYPLPREVNKENYQYAHGLTPPMHYVRKRRFRKRVSHRQLENVEEEVERLLREDAEWEKQNGKITHQEYSQADWERLQHVPPEDEYDDEMDADGDLVESTELYGDEQYVETPQAVEDDIDLEAQMADAFAEPDVQMPLASDLVTDSPAPPLASQAASYAAVENAMAIDDSAAPTPAETPIQEPMTQDEQSSDEDEDESDYDSDDEPDVIDEDAAIKAAEKAQQLEEVADLEREIAAVRAKANAMGNQLLKKRELDKLGKLEGDLRVKRNAFGLDGDGEE